jgi:hypothetical protein
MNHPYTELGYHLQMARRSAEVRVPDKTASASILRRLDDLMAFVDYLRESE